MRIVRFAEPGGQVRAGLRALDDSDITVFPDVTSVAELLTRSAAELAELLDRTAEQPPTHRRAEVVLLPPIDGRMELWAAGVTYRRSREARVEESVEQSVYERVYDAARPELFFKSTPWRVVTDGEPIAVRGDSALNVPEPELAVVANSAGEPVGFLVANDVSSRSIEGENPLYLPQAKIYAGSAALSIGIRPVSEVTDVTDLDIRLRVRRDGDVVFEGETNTGVLRRPVAELLGHLFTAQRFPEGAVLCTGTGIVPPLEFTLTAGDTVDIEIAGVGRLSNPVYQVEQAMDWLAEAMDKPAAR